MEVNKTITQSPIILFLGAGASVPLGKPAMEQFVAKLANEITSGNEASLLSMLILARGYDLEAILSDLETFLSLHYISSFVFNSLLNSEDLPLYNANQNDAARLRSLIRHSIIREYRTIDTRMALKIYQPLFDIIFSHIDRTNFCLPIFTTNYDLAIENFCGEQYAEYEFTDGLEDDPLQRETVWKPHEYEWFHISRQVRNIVLFKLHGSVDWMRLTSTGKIVKSLPMYDIVDSDEYQNTIIYPAGNKVATSEPYLTGYQYFSKCCEKAKVIVAIGYSFRDYEMLTTLLKARQMNEDLNLILLSPNAYDILKTIPDDEDRLFMARPISDYFGNPDSQANYLREIDQWLNLWVKR